MADAPLTPTPDTAVFADRRSWTVPRLAELPKLTKLTLASSIGGSGGTGGGGSTVFTPFLVASTLVASLLAGCSADRSVMPSEGSAPRPLMSIPCVANVAAKVVSCGGPLSGPGQEILGGQRVRVVLRSSNVEYGVVPDKFTFDVTVQNLSTQSIGTTGGAASGIRVFFEQAPQTITGSGTITVENTDGSGTFTAADQDYYMYLDSLAPKEISFPHPWQFDVPATVTTFSFTVLVAADVGEYGGLLRWEAVSGFQSMSALDVAAAGANDAIMVGDYGRSLRWDGSSWGWLPVVTDEPLNAAAAVGPGEYLAGDNDGGIWRLKGQIWSKVHQRADNLGITRFWVRDADHWVAVGYDGAVTWYANGVFTDEIVGTSVSFPVVTGTADGSLVTVATDAGLAYTGNGPGAWGAGVPLAGVDEQVLDIAYDADNVLLVAMLNNTSFEGLILHGTDTLFEQVAEIPTRIFPFGRDSITVLVADLIASGSYIDKLRFGAAPVHTRFTFTDTIPMLPVLSGVALDPAETKFLLSDVAGTGWINDGGSFTEVAPPANCGCFSGIWGKADSTWLVDGNSLWKVVDGVYTQLTAPAGAYKIWGFSGDELYVTADSQVWRGDGVGPWTLEATLVGNGDYLNDIWGDPASGLLIVIGDGGRWMTREGGTWAVGPDLHANFTGVWGCSASEAWLVSQDGPVVHWQSGTATIDPAYDGPYGASNYYHANVTGSGCNDVWVTGEGSFTFHWTGAAWDSVDIGTPIYGVDAVAMRAPGELYMGGDQGNAALVNGAGIMTHFTIPTDGWSVGGFWRLANGELMAYSEGKVLRGLR